MGCWWYGWIEHIWRQTRTSSSFWNISVASWLLTINFTFFRSYPSTCFWGIPLANVSLVVGDPLANFYRGPEGISILLPIFFTGYPKVLDTLWQIPEKVLTTFANSTYLSDGCQCCPNLWQRVLIILQNSWQRELDNRWRYLQEGCPKYKECGNLFTIAMKNLTVKIKIHEATDGIKKYQRSIFYLGFIHLHRF
jgi:hypothetical protein